MQKFYYSTSLMFLFIGLQMSFSAAFADVCRGAPYPSGPNYKKCTIDKDCPAFGANSGFCNTAGYNCHPNVEETKNVCWIEGMALTKENLVRNKKAKVKPAN